MLGCDAVGPSDVEGVRRVVGTQQESGGVVGQVSSAGLDFLSGATKSGSRMEKVCLSSDGHGVLGEPLEFESPGWDGGLVLVEVVGAAIFGDSEIEPSILIKVGNCGASLFSQDGNA